MALRKFVTLLPLPCLTNSFFAEGTGLGSNLSRKAKRVLSVIMVRAGVQMDSVLVSLMK
jgi:hypothetical protein